MAAPSYSNLLNVQNGVLEINWDYMEDFITNGPDLVMEPGDHFNLYEGCEGNFDLVEERMMQLWNQVGLINLEKKPMPEDPEEIKIEKSILKSFILVLNVIIFTGAESALGPPDPIDQSTLDDELIDMIKPKDMKIVSGSKSKNGTTSIIRIKRDTTYYQASFWTGFYNTNVAINGKNHSDEMTAYVLEPAYRMFQFYQFLLTIPEGMARSDIVSTKIIWAPEVNTMMHLHGQYSILVNYRQVDPDKYIHISYTRIAEMWNSFYHYYQIRVVNKKYGVNGKSSLRYTNNDVFKTLQYLRKGDSVADIGQPTRRYKKKSTFNKGYSNGNKFQNKKTNRFSNI